MFPEADGIRYVVAIRRGGWAPGAMDTIIVIDDDINTNRLIETILKNYRIIAAQTAEEGIVLVRDHQPGLILLDLKMPGMNGLTAIQILKSDPELAHIPIVAVTASMAGSEVQSAMKAGCAAYIAKPFKPGEIKELAAHYFHDT